MMHANWLSYTCFLKIQHNILTIKNMQEANKKYLFYCNLFLVNPVVLADFSLFLILKKCKFTYYVYFYLLTVYLIIMCLWHNVQHLFFQWVL